ncbi:MAG: alcohol dehydrogenase catalytic domain-containing protein, partial [Actinomycetes bacterium]
MRALRKLQPGQNSMEVVEVPVPEPGAGEVRIAVFAAGMCGTDLHIIDGTYPASPPVTLGHEIAGVVEAVGPGVADDWIGVRVAPEPAVGCGRCEWCDGGYPMHCRERVSTGTHVDGGFAPQVIVPARNLHALPDLLSDHAGALVEPLACVCNALLDPSAISFGDRVVVTGPGTIGILAAQVAMAAGAETTLIGLTRDAPRLAIASDIGLDARSLDDPKTLASFSSEVQERRINTVIECAG